MIIMLDIFHYGDFLASVPHQDKYALNVHVFNSVAGTKQILKHRSVWEKLKLNI